VEERRLEKDEDVNMKEMFNIIKGLDNKFYFRIQVSENPFKVLSSIGARILKQSRPLKDTSGKDSFSWTIVGNTREELEAIQEKLRDQFEWYKVDSN
jgi:hypothetical protein